MCGRFTLLDLADFLAMFPWVAPPPAFAPRYNVAPTQPVLMLNGRNGGTLDLALWGLIPAWARRPEDVKPLINARCETVMQKPAFRGSFRHKRCVVPATGFYEWARGAGGKQPYHITQADGKPMLMAGLYEDSHDGSGGEFKTLCIITTPASEAMVGLHDRMPALLTAETARRWVLAPQAEAEGLVELLRPYPGEIRKTPVDRRVNSPGHDARDCIEPITLEEERGLFGAL